MRYELSGRLSGEAFSIPREAEAYFAEAGESELRVLLFACRVRAFDEEEIVAALGLESSAVREALAFWRGAGIFVKGGTKTEKQAEKNEDAPRVKILSSRPNYTSFDVANAIDRSPEFKSLIDYTEQTLEKMLSRAELSQLYSFVDYLGLPVDVVMLAIESCVKEGKKNLRYIEKLLIALVDAEITEYEAADAYFASRAEYLSFEGKIRAMCGFSSRALTAAEKKIITAWKDEAHYTQEEIAEAYEKTVNAISKPSVSYMNKVLRTLREGSPKESDPQKTYDTESRFAKALARPKRTKREE